MNHYGHPLPDHHGRAVQDLKIKENLKAVRSWTRDCHETLRMGVGRMVRTSFEKPLGVPVPCEPRRYNRADSGHDVWIRSPEDGHYMSTFFDVSAFSPSGRYLAMTHVPFIWRQPYPGDPARVSVIDLHRDTCTPVYETKGWGTQLGANVQWGSDDETLFCNDVVDGQGTGVVIDRGTGSTRILDGPIYGLSPDRRYSFSGDLRLINAGIPGYGIPERFLNKRRLTDPTSMAEGVWRTELDSGHSELFISIHDIVSALPDQEHLRGGKYYVFNVKVNRSNDRLLIVIFTRGAPGRRGWPPQLVTCDMQGGDIHLAIPDRLWRWGGHHPNWAPDGDHIIMNLRGRNEPMAFVRFRYDGSDLTTLAPGHKGSGHPSLDPTGRYLLTDAYVTDGFTDLDGHVPIRLIDLASNQELTVARVFTNRILGPRRVDPHPVWSPDGQKICFNGVIDGRRQVFVAERSRVDGVVP